MTGIPLPWRTFLPFPRAIASCFFAVIAVGALACRPGVVREDQRGNASLDASASAWQNEIDAMTAGACSDPTAAVPQPISRSLTVDAQDSWTSSELFVAQGSNIKVSAEGTWTTWNGTNPLTGPEGDDRLTSQEGCARGSLVARIGLGGEEGAVRCLGPQTSFTADAAGILYFGINDASAATLHAGSMTLTIDATALIAPNVPFEEAATYNFCTVPSGWVEVQTETYLTLTTPAALAAKHQATLAPSLSRLDDVVVWQSRLAAGALPSGGRRARFYPDASVRGSAWIVSGNPMRFDPRLLSKVEPSRISLLAVDADDAELFDVVRALGVNMSRHAGGRYQADEKAAQAWGGLFARYVEEERSIGRWPRDACADVDTQIASGTESTWLASADMQLCFLLRVRDAAGWSVFESFFAALPAPDGWDAAIASGSDPETTWRWVVGALMSAAPVEVGLVAEEMHAPTP